MALLLLSALVNDIKGKVGGTVFKGGTGGSHVMQRKSNKRNQQSSYSLSTSLPMPAKVAIQSISQYWNSLSVVTRKSWDSHAVNFPYKNKLGQKKVYSGYSFFMSINVRLAQLGLSAVINPPSFLNAIQLGRVYLTTTGISSDLEFDYDNSPIGSGYIVIMCTRSMNLARQPVASDFKIVKILPGATSTPVNIHSDYVSVFGTIPTIGTITLKAYSLNNITGALSVEQSSTLSFP